MLVDPFPSRKRTVPDAHIAIWWSKFKHTTGYVTECIAPNRQRIWYMAFGNPLTRSVKYTTKHIAFVTVVAATLGLRAWANQKYYDNLKAHWD